MPDFSLGANYIYKRFGNMIFADYFHGAYGGSSRRLSPTLPPGLNSWVQTSETFEGQEVVYYELREGLSRVGDLTANWPDYHQEVPGHRDHGPQAPLQRMDDERRLHIQRQSRVL